jgi:hypothetical protein
VFFFFDSENGEDVFASLCREVCAAAVSAVAAFWLDVFFQDVLLIFFDERFLLVE